MGIEKTHIRWQPSNPSGGCNAAEEKEPRESGGFIEIRFLYISNYDL